MFQKKKKKKYKALPSWLNQKVGLIAADQEPKPKSENGQNKNRN